MPSVPVRVALGVALAALLLAPPLVGADHVYSHRYVVKGRILDPSGSPLPDLPVWVGRTNFSSEGRCNDPRETVTDDRGDFEYCFHTHALREAAAVEILLKLDNRTHQFHFPADRDLRQTAVQLVLPNSTGTKPKDWQTVYLVEGRAWMDSPDGNLDGVPVTGVALAKRNLSVTLQVGRDEFKGTIRTDGYGDFAANFNLPVPVRPATRGNVTIAYGNESVREPLNPFAMRSHLALKLNATGEDPGLDPATPATARDPTSIPMTSAPGSKAPRLVPLLPFGALVAAFVVAALAGRGRS